MSLLYKITDSPITKLIKGLSQVVLHPIVPGSLLLFLTQAPEHTRNEVLQRLSIPVDFDFSLAKTVLQVLLGLGLIRYLNAKLSTIASNGWRVTEAKGWSWPQEVAVVTGGSSGIGLSVVQGLANKAIRVAIFDINGPPKELANRANVRFYKCDVTSPKSVADAADAVRRDFGHPTILINNAGIARPFTILDIPEEALQKIFAVNTLSHWTTVKQFLPNMIQKNKGHVVTVASIASFVALPKAADYSSTKASALAFHEALQSEINVIYKSPGVLTTVIHPNFVNTPLVADFKSNLADGGVTFLTADQVASEITGQIFKKQGAQVVVPRLATGVSALRGWPTWLQVLVRDVVGANSAKINSK